VAEAIVSVLAEMGGVMTADDLAVRLAVDIKIILTPPCIFD
jgi:hypothetical protein